MSSIEVTKRLVFPILHIKNCACLQLTNIDLFELERLQLVVFTNSVLGKWKKSMERQMDRQVDRSICPSVKG